MTYDALRKGRTSLPHHAYLITTVTHNRIPWFSQFDLARTTIHEIARLHTMNHVNSLAWVLMPDHLHWLVQLKDNKALPDVMKSFKGRSSRLVNQILRRKGPIWQRAYHDHAVRENEDIRGMARYIVFNPIRAGLVNKIGEYPFWDAIWL